MAEILLKLALNTNQSTEKCITTYSCHVQFSIGTKDMNTATDCSINIPAKCNKYSTTKSDKKWLQYTTNRSLVQVSLKSVPQIFFRCLYFRKISKIL